MRYLIAVMVAMSLGLAQDGDARRELLTDGTLRVGINANNPLTRAVGAELARELARRLGANLTLTEYPSPGAVVAAVGTGWDIAFVAADPDRAAAIAFTPPYVELDATYLVTASSPIRSVADVDKAGVSIATAPTAAYTLVLRRELALAGLVPLDADEATAALLAGKVNAVAGLRFTLLETAARVPGTRVLPDTFTRAQQAIAVPRARTAALRYLTAFVEDVTRSGLVAAAITRTGLAGARVPR